MALSDWIDRKYLGDSAVSRLRAQFSAARPFQYLDLQDFFRREVAASLVRALASENFEPKQSDLFSLKQTKDFAGSANPVLRAFRDFLASPEFISYMAQVTGERLKPGVVDCAGSLYEDCDFLLPHDDRLEGRSIAYIYYLSSLERKDGGSLDLYSCRSGKPVKVEKILFPKFNKLTFFRVSNISYHQVSEVVSGTPRASITGWLHGK